MDEIKKTMSLTKALQDIQVKVVEINGGRELRSKLMALGIVPGLKLIVKKKALFGPLLISVFNETIMLNRGMAEKIFVR